MSGKLYYWIADWNLSRAEAARKLGGSVGDMIDATSGNFEAHIRPSLMLLRNHDIHLSGYITGSSDIRWTPEQLRSAGALLLWRIDQSDQNLPLHADARLVKDVEGGASQVPVAVEVAKERIDAGQDYVVYCSQAVLHLLEEEAVRAGLPHGEIIAYQYASPSSNPNLLCPGIHRPLSAVDVDLSVVKLTPAREPVAQHSPAHRHSLAQARVNGTLVQVDLRDMHWSTPADPNAHVVPEPWAD